tara:strand:+ start:609 stop:2072 length:1464 start_codon:yes stop_codon:yes gene_type:complete
MASSFFNRGISSTAYTGRAVAPGAIADAAESKALINKNSLQLGIVASQIQSLGAQMQSLTGSLQVIGTQITASRQIQEQKDQQEADLENRLAQQKLREGKESVIEKKIQAAALAPAQRLASKAQFTLGRLQGFFISVFGGWLLNKGVETIKALSEGNKDKLVEIRNNVLKNLAIIASIYVGIKLGIAAIMGTFSVLGVKLLAAAAIGLFTKPGRDFLSFIKNAGLYVANAIAQFAGFDPPFETPDSGDDAERKSSGSNVTLSLADESTTTANQNLEIQGQKPSTPKTDDKPEIKTETGKGNLNGRGGPSVADSIESLRNSADVTRRISNDLLKTMSKEGDDNVELDPPGPTDEAEYGQTKLTVDFGSGEVDLSKPMGSEKNKVGQKVADPETLEYISQEQYIGKYGKLPPSMLESMGKSKDVARRVSQAPPDPGVTVIPMQTPSQEPPTAAAAVASGGIGKVDNYPTSNDDNIYTFGAMSNFNVVSV